jgi:8-hydroxy-5-deazaflavin:NADPH oxidoreductase
MNIGIIGSGKIGGTTAKLFAGVNHQVRISNSRGPASLSALVVPLGPRVQAATVEEAARFGDVVLVAIPLGKYRTLPAAALSGKVVIDAMNYYPQRDGQIDVGALTSSELVAQHLSGARVVKAFNTMYFETLANQGRPAAPIDERLALFVAGDDAAAKTIVSRLIEEIGFAPIDTGSLHDGGGLQQPGAPIYNHPMAAPEARAAVRAGR